MSESIIKVFLYAMLTALATGLGALPFIFFKKVSREWLGFAGGAMIWMVFSEIIPEANQDTCSKRIGVIIAISVVLMIIFQEFLR
jgi:ZIP family zinc transporter